MKQISLFVLFVATVAMTLGLSSCATQGVQDARASGLSNRQDRIDARTTGRTERAKVRSDRADARFDARFDAM